MLYRNFRLALLLVLGIGLLSFSSVNAQEGRQVWAFYVGFWVGNDSWGWQADVLDDYPAIGTYDSRDQGVVATQIDQAKSAGIDAFVVSWFGLQDGWTTTPALNNILDRAGERDFKVGAVVDVYTEQYHRDRQSLVDSLNWLIHQRANHPAYLRMDGKPVVMFAFQDLAGFTNEEWQSIRDEVDPNRISIWIAEGINGCCIYGGVMDGMYAFNLAWANGSSGRYNTERYATRNAGGSIHIPTIHPGWDETKIAEREGRENPTDPRGRADGRFLANSFNGAVASGAEIILIGTWNEFVENSHIEPSQNHGSQSLDTLRPLIADWKGNAPPIVINEQTTTNNVIPPNTPTLTANTVLNVRPQPTTDGDPIGSIAPGTPYAIVGQQNGWYAIKLNGQTGWVSADYVKTENVVAVPVENPAPVADNNVPVENPAPVVDTSAPSTTITSGRVAIMGNDLNVRSLGSIEGEVIGMAPMNNEYLVLNQIDGWVQIDFGGQAGWVLGTYVIIEDR